MRSIMLGTTEVNDAEALELIDWLASVRDATLMHETPVIMDEIEQQLIDLAHNGVSEQCIQADEWYKTARFAGTPEYNSRLYDHALTCKRRDWHHALNTQLWSLVELRRSQQPTKGN